MKKENQHDKDKPHICLYIGSLQQGGAERVMTNLAEYLYDEGWDVTFVTTYFRPPEYSLLHGLWFSETGQTYEEEEEDRNGFLVRWGNTKTVCATVSGIRRVYSDPAKEELEKGRIRGFFARYQKLRAIWKTEKPDIILSFIGYNNLFAVLTSLGLHIPVVVSVRSNPAYEYDSKKLRIPAFILFRKADGVVLQTKEAKDFFPRAVQKKATILPNALNQDFIRPVYEGVREKEVVSVGRLDENKNQGYLIEQFAIAHAKHPEYKLVLYGEGPSKDVFEQKACRLGVGDCVVFAGRVDHVREHIEKSSIFVLSSKTEGMPNALLEAMSCGLACISTDCPCGGPGDLIQDGENGFLVPVPKKEESNGKEDLLGQRLIQLMDDPDLCARMGRRASEVQKTYSPKKVNARWEEYLGSLIRT